MKSSGSNLSPEMENQWLNYIYDFETLHKNAKEIKIYDYIGKPEFRKISVLTKDEVGSELDRLFEILEKNSVVVYFCCDYDDEIIYKFITEELFEEEIDDIQIPGMRTCFNYEEFHPNHEYDIRERSKNIIESLFRHDQWNDMCTEFYFSKEIKCDQKKFNQANLNEVLREIHDSIIGAVLNDTQIDSSEFNLEINKATVAGIFIYILNGINKTGNFKFGLEYSYEYWTACEFELEL